MIPTWHKGPSYISKTFFTLFSIFKHLNGSLTSKWTPPQLNLWMNKFAIEWRNADAKKLDFYFSFFRISEIQGHHVLDSIWFFNEVRLIQFSERMQKTGLNRVGSGRNQRNFGFFSNLNYDGKIAGLYDLEETLGNFTSRLISACSFLKMFRLCWFCNIYEEWIFMQFLKKYFKIFLVSFEVVLLVFCNDLKFFSFLET